MSGDRAMVSIVATSRRAVNRRSVKEGLAAIWQKQMKKEEITTAVTLLGIVPGDPPYILIGRRLSRGGKPGRLFQQLVPVPDAHLFACLIAEAHTGDTVTVTVTTEWYENGYKTYVSGFALPASPDVMEAEQARV